MNLHNHRCFVMMVVNMSFVLCHNTVNIPTCDFQLENYECLKVPIQGEEGGLKLICSVRVNEC